MFASNSSRPRLAVSHFSISSPGGSGVDGCVRPRLVDPPALLAFGLDREHVVQVEVGLECLHALERAIDVCGDARGELALEHVGDRRDFRTDAVDVIGDQAGTEAQQRLDLRGIGRRPHSGAQVAACRSSSPGAPHGS